MIKYLRKKLSGKASCPDGCYRCCRTKIYFIEEEWERIKDRPTPNGKGEAYCEYLDEDGRCSIYDERPIICRAMGKVDYLLLNCRHIKEELPKPPIGLEEYLRECKHGSKNGVDHLEGCNTPTKARAFMKEVFRLECEGEITEEEADVWTLLLD